ncbi:MAG: thiamine pyrophosphate-dependent enzyme [Candidatus Ranarchaeia archaeon]
MPALRELVKKPAVFMRGHRMCAGCGAATIARQVTLSLRGPTIICNATGCLEVASSIFPYTSWNAPWIHNAFENVAATASGVEAAYRALIRKGRYRGPMPDVVVFGGDGGTIDIGLQSLSGAIERGHDFLYILYDNSAYMNTGIHRSGGTLPFAATTTSPAGKKIPGKIGRAKPIARIVAAHENIKYVATASPAYPVDLTNKVQRGLNAKGPAFIHIISSCTLGWGHETNIAIRIVKTAVETCVHPLWEFRNEEGQRKYSLSGYSRVIAKNPDKKKPVETFLKPQKRFKHLFVPSRREDLIGEFQNIVDTQWNAIKKLCNLG